MPHSSTKGRFLEKCRKSDKVRTFEYNSAKSFIESGYPNADAVYMMPIQEKLLSELAPEDLKIMLDDFCYFLTLSMRHPISVSQSSDSMRYAMLRSSCDV